MFTAIQGPARKIVLPDHLPTSPRMMPLSNEEFVNKLKGVILPAGELEAAKMEFEYRTQLPGNVLSR